LCQYILIAQITSSLYKPAIFIINSGANKSKCEKENPKLYRRRVSIYTLRSAKQVRFDLLVRRVLLLAAVGNEARQSKSAKLGQRGRDSVAITERALDGELCGGLLALSSEFAQHQIVHIFSAAPNVKN
jgi:hypothetical protein